MSEESCSRAERAMWEIEAHGQAGGGDGYNFAVEALRLNVPGLVNRNGKHGDYVTNAAYRRGKCASRRGSGGALQEHRRGTNVSIMNRNSRFTTAALVALLAGAPVAVFAQSNPPGTPSTAADSSMSSNSTANPGMETAAAPNSSVSGNNVQSGAARPGYNGQARMNTGTELALSQSTLENVQQQLQQQGFYRTGKVDGRWGPETHQAVLSFQQSKGLQTTGQLDRQTLDALGVHKQGG